MGMAKKLTWETTVMAVDEPTRMVAVVDLQWDKCCYEINKVRKAYEAVFKVNDGLMYVWPSNSIDEAKRICQESFDGWVQPLL